MAEWRNWDDVKERVVAAVEYGASAWARATLVSIETDVVEGVFDSPIEAIFSAWWDALTPFYGMEWARLESQYAARVEGEAYRIDFIVNMSSHPADYGSRVWVPYPKIAIELDGHDYHERTKEQVTYRNQRDRALQSAGWQVLHISGSELFRSPEKCVAGVMGQTTKAWSAFWAEYWERVNKQVAERVAMKQGDALTTQES